ncbi:hypothetical protein WEU32_06785 [Brevundimonas sp. BH3]|uniref:hypothetical protein n=1 Tax=Brevundimonas sp. BH3 TaxID=3133089 RepID=UPI00324E0468
MLRKLDLDRWMRGTFIFGCLMVLTVDQTIPADLLFIPTGLSLWLAYELSR